MWMIIWGTSGMKSINLLSACYGIGPMSFWDAMRVYGWATGIRKGKASHTLYQVPLDTLLILDRVRWYADVWRWRLLLLFFAHMMDIVVPGNVEGIVESLASPYTKKYPLPSIPFSREHTLCSSILPRERTLTPDQKKPWPASERELSQQFLTSRIRL